MRDHAIVSPQFWTGETGRKLREDPEAQRMALYLITCPSSNMTGLYYLPLPTICHELGSPFEGASKALRRVCELGFASYDEAFDTVFVHEMAKFQLGDSLSPKDNRIKAVERQLRPFRKSYLYNAFLEKYREAYSLGLEPSDVSPFEAPSKPLRSQGQGQGQGQGQDKERECVSDETCSPGEEKEDSKADDGKIRSEEQLDALIDAWNDQPRNMCPEVEKRRAKGIVDGWRRVQKHREPRDALSDVEAVMAAVRRATWAHGKGWFKFSWLFACGKGGDWNISKLLDGHYIDGQKTFGKHTGVEVSF